MYMSTEQRHIQRFFNKPKGCFDLALQDYEGHTNAMKTKRGKKIRGGKGGNKNIKTKKGTKDEYKDASLATN